MSAPKPTQPGPILFMGEQEDPELENLLARGDTFVYGINRMPVDTESSPPAAPALCEPNPAAGHHILTSSPARWVKCGCGRCYMGPCPNPVEFFASPPRGEPGILYPLFTGGSPKKE